MSNVVFFPRKDYDVEVCQHRLGKSMTYTACTDTLRQGYDEVMALAKARSIKMSAFAYANDEDNVSAKAATDASNGHIWLDMYMRLRVNGNVVSYTDNDEIISNEQIFLDTYAYDVAKFQQRYGKLPIMLSYWSGKYIPLSDYCKAKFLAGRISARTSSVDYSGYSIDSMIAKGITSRWYDDAKVSGDWSGRLATLSSAIDSCKTNGGWYTDFQHWHNVYDDGNMSHFEDYLDILAAKNADNSIYYSGYGEAVAYLAYRSLITRAVMYAPKAKSNTLIIQLETKDNDDASIGNKTDLLQVPISIRFSTIGTALAGKQIKSDCNLINEGNGSYIVEIPYGAYPMATIEEQ